MDKQNVVYLYNGILFSHNTESSTDTFHNMVNIKKHYAKWKKPDTKTMYFIFHFIWNNQDRQSRLVERRLVLT